MTYISPADVEPLITALRSTRALPDNHLTKDETLAHLELRLQETIDELTLAGVADDDPLLIKLRSL